VTGEVPAGCLGLHRLFPDLMASSSLHGWFEGSGINDDDDNEEEGY